MAHFISESCIGCSMCLKSCPVHAISGTLKQRHVINPDICIDCNACGIVCAKGAVIDESGNPCAMVPPDRRLRPLIDADKCVGCELCIENCVKEALRLGEPEFHGDTHITAELVNEKQCVGCGYCVSVCPQKAISMAERGQK